MSRVRLVALVLATFIAACGGPVRNQPPPAAPPPAAPPPAAGGPAAPTTLGDPRAESYGGTVGSLDEITWLVASSHTAMHAYRAGYSDIYDGVVLRRGANGLEWAIFRANGGFKATSAGVIVGTRSIAHGQDPSGGPWAHWKTGPDQVVKYRTVPAAKLAALRAIVERTPLPLQPTSTVAMGISVEISTATRHLQGDFGGSLARSIRIATEPSRLASPDAPGASLADMATRIVALAEAQ
jgi:hypothetical protein